jgi:flagellar biosynthesis chaperone FliJ
MYVSQDAREGEISALRKTVEQQESEIQHLRRILEQVEARLDRNGL